MSPERERERERERNALTLSVGLHAAQGYYAYIESSGARVNGDNARLESLTMNPSQSYCLTFWYHLYGNSIGNINVRINVSAVYAESPTPVGV